MNTKNPGVFTGIIEPLDIKTSDSGILNSTTFAAKDLLDVEGHVTSGGNPDWKRTHNKASANCAAIQLILDASSHLIGKTLTDELAFSLDGLNVHYPIAYNPNMPGHLPGGSSSGSASAVANDICDFALGTDTAGSIRVPSAFCGIFGMRPTHGLISMDGCIPLGTTFDTIGWMSKSASLMNKIGSVLLRDPMEEPRSYPILFPEETLQFVNDNLHQPLKRIWQDLVSLQNISRPSPDIKIQILEKLHQYSSLFNTARGYEAWRAHGDWFEQTKPNMDPAIASRFESCKKISLAQYEQSLQERLQLKKDANALLSSLDCYIFIPTVCDWPLPITASEASRLQARQKNILLNSLASFCGLPQVTIPFKIGERRFSFSLVGKEHSDMQLLATALMIEQSGILL